MKNNTDMLNGAKKPWYKRPGRLALIAIIFLVLWVAAGFVGQVLKYTDEINLESITTEGFSEVSNTNTAPQNTANRLKLETTSDPTFGNPDAKVVVVEFGDFQCPFCARAFPLIRSLHHTYQDDVLFIWRDLPLTDIHPEAQQAAEAGECAHEQGKFWEYHDKLFINQHDLSIIALRAYAAEVGLNPSQFNTCLNSRKHLGEIDEDIQAALAAGAAGTPSFFINGQLITGTPPEEQFKALLDSFISIYSEDNN